MITLAVIIQSVMAEYAKKGVNSESYLTVNEQAQIYSVITFAQWQGKRHVNTTLVARIVDNYVVIELDFNDDLLRDALIQAGVPDEQIILAYDGKHLPEAI